MAVDIVAMLDLLRPLLARRTAMLLPDPTDAAAIATAFGGAGRRVGKAAVALDEVERARLREHGVDWPVATRTDELWRIALLVAAGGRDDAERLIAECYRHGDTDERCAVLRALPLLPDPERFTSLAADACRSSVQPIFEAIACENPYPVRHLEPLHFNQMVLKALFLDVPLARVLGLDGRCTQELTRMARDYAAERRAAGRPVSEDLARLAGDVP